MCGIAGIVNLSDALAPPSRELLERMVRAIHHRGPDEFGLFRDVRAALGHARLSIVDLASGQQPLANEDGTLHVVFNGEIFNHVELREELSALGHTFRTRSDTEVIVHAWEAWGDACLARFNGQWAFALWDSTSGTLILARDRVGVRPLHIQQSGGRVRFASEVKALFQDPEVPRAIDAAGLVETFTFWAPRAPRTLFEGVTELPPGSVRTYDRHGAVTERVWWRPGFPTEKLRADRTEENAERLLSALRDATRLRMVRADVPVGAYLSGGLDSAVVASLAREASPATLHTFSLRFEDAEYDETPHQRLMAERLGSVHHEVVATRGDIAKALPEVIFHTERAIVRAGPAPLFLLSALVRREGMKVVVTGEGADEFLGGYDLFREARVRRFWARHPESAVRPRLFDRLYPWLARSPQASRTLAMRFWARGLDRPDAPDFSHGPRWSSAAALQRFLTPAVLESAKPEGDPIERLLATLPAEFSKWDPLCRAQHLEITTLLSSYILSSQGDRVLMGNSIEGRFPFLDADVMALANSLPPDDKLFVLDEKHVLKLAAKSLIPAEITARPKQPYRAPDAVCFVGPAAPAYVREVLSPRAVSDAGLFDATLVQGLYDKCARSAERGALSNADNMAFLGVLTAQLVVDSLVRVTPAAPAADRTPGFRTVIDRVG